MMYSEEKYEALRQVCVSYKNDYDKAFERLRHQQREIDKLKEENAKRLNAIEDFTNKTCCLKCDIAKLLVKEFAEKLKEICVSKRKFIDIDDEEEYYFDGAVTITEIDELLKEYEK